MRTRLLPLLLPLLILLCAPALAAPEAPGFRWDWKDVPTSLDRLLAAQDPTAAAIRRDIWNGPAALAQEKRLAHEWGIPLTKEEWTRLANRPGEDAGPLYEKASKLLSEKQWTEKDDDLWQKLADGHITPEEVQRLRSLLDERQPAMQMLHRAAAAPHLTMPAPTMTEPGFPTMATLREASKMLRDEALLLAVEGRFEDAVAAQTLGYGVARHAYQSPTLIGYLVGVAIEAISDSGMERILQVAGPDPVVAQSVRTALAEAPTGASLAYAFRGEALCEREEFDIVRKHGPRALTVLLVTDADVDDSVPLDAEAPPVRQLTPAEKRWWNDLVCAMHADYMRRLRGLIVAAQKPYPASRAEMERIVPKTIDPRDPVSAYSAYVLGIYPKVTVHEARRLARSAVIDAGAAVLSYKARTGSWPEDLSQALGGATDPFTGKPLGYRAEGGFVVYSAGESGTFAARIGQPERGETLFRYPKATD